MTVPRFLAVARVKIRHLPEPAFTPKIRGAHDLAGIPLTWISHVVQLDQGLASRGSGAPPVRRLLWVGFGGSAGPPDTFRATLLPN